MKSIVNVGQRGFDSTATGGLAGAAVYIAEMDRTAENLQFDVELANQRIIGRETITNANPATHQKKDTTARWC